LENSSSNVWPRKILFFIFNGKLIGFVIIKAKQDFKPINFIELSIKLLSHWSTMTANTFLAIKTQHLEFKIVPLKIPYIKPQLLFM
jgi:hypothetical protein